MNDDARTADEILADLLAGELEPTATEARELFDRDPLAWERWQTLQGLTDRLAAAGDEQRADLAEAPGLAPADSTAVAEVIREHTSGRQRASAPSVSKRRPWAALAASAAALLLAFWIWGPDDAAPAPVEVLGAEPGELYPVGDVADYSVFAWDLPEPSGGWFVVKVFDDTDAGRGRPVATSPDLSEQTWTPEFDTTRWPDAIRWEVFSIDGMGDTLDGDGGRARRTPP